MLEDRYIGWNDYYSFLIWPFLSNYLYFSLTNLKHPRAFQSACITNGTIPSKNQASYHYNLHNCIYFLSWRQMKRVNHITTEARGVFFDRKVSLMTSLKLIKKFYKIMEHPVTIWFTIWLIGYVSLFGKAWPSSWEMNRKKKFRLHLKLKSQGCSQMVKNISNTF